MTTTKKPTKVSATADQLNRKISPAIDDDDEIPPLDEAFWANAQMGSPLKKRLISLRLDNDVVDWFKHQGPSYQTRMNQVLRAYMEFAKRDAVRNK